MNHFNKIPEPHYF